MGTLIKDDEDAFDLKAGKKYLSNVPKVSYNPILSLFQKTKVYRIKAGSDEILVKLKPCHIKWNETGVAYLNGQTVFGNEYTIEKISMDQKGNLVSKMVADKRGN